MNVTQKAIGIIVLVALAVVAQVIVGALGQVSQITNSTLQDMAFTSALSAVAATNSFSVNIVAANAITTTLSGNHGWISSSHPLTIEIVGTGISSFATNEVAAVEGGAQTQTYTLTSPAASQTLTASAGNFFSISNVILLGPTGLAFPSVTASVSQTGLYAVPSSAPWANTINSLTASGTATITQGQAIVWFNTAGQSPTTILNFMTIIFLVAALVILLSLFGMDKIFNLGNQAGTKYGGRND